MDNNKVFSKLEKIEEHLARIDVTLAVNTEQLKIHIEGVQLARADHKLLVARVKPLEDRKAHVDGAVKLLATLATIAGLLLAYLKLKH